jgi:class 3 adenylate cyclase
MATIYKNRTDRRMADDKKKSDQALKQTKQTQASEDAYNKAYKAALEKISRLLHEPAPSRLWDDYLSAPSRILLTGSPDYELRSALGMRSQLGALESEMTRLRSEINEKAQALSEQTLDAKEKETQIGQLKTQLDSLAEKQRLSHLLNRVGTPAQQKLLDSVEFRSQFDRDSPCPAYVLSIDIRRSTELMLKARDAKLFAQFLMSLAGKLRQVVLDHYGIFDKFTGDGILAFFPEFYSGSDAGYFALKAASACHDEFVSHYESHKHCFVSVLREIGLGIGLDYGWVQVVQLGGDFTVVGTPVVYACRMGGADAGHTYVNQPAFEQLFERYSAICDFDKCEIDIKHEGRTLAYSVQLNGKEHEPTLPDWNGSKESSPTPKTEKSAKSSEQKKA